MGSDLEAADEGVRALQVRLAAAEAKVAQLQKWLDVTFETSPVAMGIISTFENRYLRVNRAMAELYGMSTEEILRSDPFSLALNLTHKDDLVAEQKLFAELAVGERAFYRIEKRFVRPDGSIRSALLTLAAVFGDAAQATASVGPIQSTVIQGIDTTEHKALTETLQRREAELEHAQKIDSIGRLAAGVAHDFNNLLTVITGNGELLKRRLNRASSEDGLVLRDMGENLEAILSAADRAASLTAQLLAHGRREGVTRQTIVLSDLVATLQRLFSRSLESSVELALDATGSIFADQGQISQVVMNLVLNARDAIGERGQIQIATSDLVVTADTSDPSLPGPGAWVALAISDTGHGMSAEIRARMFEPFFTTRADRPGTRGTGLGLSTVQRIVAESAGQIRVESTPAVGTRVTIFFPRTERAPKEPESRELHGRPAHVPNSLSVLVVEDEPAVRSLIGTVLLGAHYRVSVARDGEEALRFIASAPEPFDLIVTDLVMPNIGGAALATHLHDRGIAPRMLFISGYSSHAPAELSAHGSLLAKPFTPAELLAAVAQALQDRG